MSQAAILVINGEINLSFICQYINQLDYQPDVYCTDGAFDKISGAHFLRNVQAVIGDFDSLNEVEFQRNHSNIKMVKITNQNMTDFAKALQYLSERHEKLIIFGLGGGELDHSLGNISEATKWFKKINIEFIDTYSKYFLTDCSINLNNVLGKMVSIVPLFIAQEVSYCGLKYSLQKQTLDFFSSIGTRNYAIKNQVNITFSSGLILVFISHKPYQHYLEDVYASTKHT